MKRMVIAGLVICCALCFPAGAEDAAAPEGRALWVTRFDYKTAGDVAKIMENCAAYNFNQILFQVRGNGTVFYKSRIEPWAFELTSGTAEATGRDPGWDPLETAVLEGHRRGLQVHAYMNVFPAWRTQKFPPVESGQLWHAHPDWFMVWGDGTKMLPPDRDDPNNRWGDWYSFISPGVPEVQDYLVEVFREVVEKYEVDGIHFDYIRYPSEIGDFSYDARSLERFQRKYGHSPDQLPHQWIKWRSDQVTAVARRVYDTCCALRPGLIVSAAAIGDYPRGSVRYYQRSQEWMEEGILDIAMPMVYTADDDAFTTRVQNYRENCYGRLVYPGISAGRNNPEGLLRQIRISKELGCPGVAFFAYSSFFPQHRPGPLAETLKAGPFAKKAPAPAADWKHPNPAEARRIRPGDDETGPARLRQGRRDNTPGQGRRERRGPGNP